MKKLLIALLLVLTLAMTLAFVACGGEYDYVYHKDGFDDSALAIRDEFFAKTLAYDNVEVTVTDEEGNVSYVETIADGIDRLVSDGFTDYVYKKESGGVTDYYYVLDCDDLKYYIVYDNSEFYDTAAFPRDGEVDPYGVGNVEDVKAHKVDRPSNYESPLQRRRRYEHKAPILMGGHVHQL